MVTDSLYLLLAERELADCIRAEMKHSGSACSQWFATIFSLLMQSQVSSIEGAVTITKIMTTENLHSSRRISDAQRCCVYVAKLTAVLILP